jgi:hypothetical protein
MNRTDADRLGWAGGGAIAAVLLGMVLVPLRELTSASNLTFAFLALTIVVAEFGGGGAAVATALASSLSLDFFLTRPYLTLAMEDKHDLFALLGLTACGLVAAAVGSHQSGRAAALRACRAREQLVRFGLEQLAKGVPRDLALARLLDASLAVLPVSDAAVHDTSGNLLAATGTAGGRPVPAAHLDALRATPPAGGGALARNGVRVPLVAGAGAVGWLDVWVDVGGAGAGAGEALTDVVRLLVLILVRAERGAAGAESGLPESASPG